MKGISIVLAASAFISCAYSQGFVRSSHRNEVLKGPRPAEIYAPEDLPKAYDTREVLKSMGAQISTSRNQHIP